MPALPLPGEVWYVDLGLIHSIDDHRHAISLAPLGHVSVLVIVLSLVAVERREMYSTIKKAWIWS